MPVKDKIHDAVRNALAKDGWKITHDPYTIRYAELRVHADLAAERLLAAERGKERIAVEIKSFLGPSRIRELELAIGQFMLYYTMLEMVAPNRRLYLAIDRKIYEQLFCRKGVQSIVEKNRLSLIVVDTALEEIVQWVMWPRIVP